MLEKTLCHLPLADSRFSKRRGGEPPSRGYHIGKLNENEKTLGRGGGRRRYGSQW